MGKGKGSGGNSKGEAVAMPRPGSSGSLSTTTGRDEPEGVPLRFLNDPRDKRTLLHEAYTYGGLLVLVFIFCILAPILAIGWLFLPFTHGIWAFTAFLIAYTITQNLPPYFSATYKNGPLHRPIIQALEDYLPECNVIKETDLDPKKSYVFAWHPHGRMFYGFGMLVGLFSKWFPEMSDAGRHMFGGINDTMFRIPFVGNWLHLVGLIGANKHEIKSKLKHGDSVGLIIGGIEEVLEGTFDDKDVLYLENRKGFAKIAMDHSSGVVPIFCFGENSLFSHVSPSHLKFWRMVNKYVKLGAPFPVVGRWGSPVPKPVPMLIVIGKPLFAQEGESVVDFHARYVKELRKLHSKYVSISADPKRQLVIV